MAIKTNNDTILTKEIKFKQGSNPEKDVTELWLDGQLVWKKVFTFSYDATVEGLDSVVATRTKVTDPSTKVGDVVANGDQIYLGETLSIVITTKAGYSSTVYNKTVVVDGDLNLLFTISRKSWSYRINLLNEDSKAEYSFDNFNWTTISESTTINDIDWDSTLYVKPKEGGLVQYNYTLIASDKLPHWETRMYTNENNNGSVSFEFTKTLKTYTVLIHLDQSIKKIYGTVTESPYAGTQLDDYYYDALQDADGNYYYRIVVPYGDKITFTPVVDEERYEKVEKIVYVAGSSTTNYSVSATRTFWYVTLTPSMENLSRAYYTIVDTNNNAIGGPVEFTETTKVQVPWGNRIKAVGEPLEDNETYTYSGYGIIAGSGAYEDKTIDIKGTKHYKEYTVNVYYDSGEVKDVKLDGSTTLTKTVHYSDQVVVSATCNKDYHEIINGVGTYTIIGNTNINITVARKEVTVNLTPVLNGIDCVSGISDIGWDLIIDGENVSNNSKDFLYTGRVLGLPYSTEAHYDSVKYTIENVSGTFIETSATLKPTVTTNGYKVTFTKGNYISSAFTSTSSTATSGDASGTSYLYGTTVYSFVIKNANTNQYTYTCSGTQVSGNVYRVGSTVVNGETDLGTLSSVTRTTNQYAVNIGTIDYAASVFTSTSSTATSGNPSGIKYNYGSKVYLFVKRPADTVQYVYGGVGTCVDTANRIYRVAEITINDSNLGYTFNNSSTSPYVTRALQKYKVTFRAKYDETKIEDTVKDVEYGSPVSSSAYYPSTWSPSTGTRYTGGETNDATVTGAITVVTNYAALEYYVTVSKDSNVSTCTASQWVNANGSLTIEASAKTYFEITGGTGAITVDGPKTINVTSARQEVTIDLNPVLDGEVYWSGIDDITWDVYVNDSKVATNVKDYGGSGRWMGLSYKTVANTYTSAKYTISNASGTLKTTSLDLRPTVTTKTYTFSFTKGDTVEDVLIATKIDYETGSPSGTAFKYGTDLSLLIKPKADTQQYIYSLSNWTDDSEGAGNGYYYVRHYDITSNINIGTVNINRYDTYYRCNINQTINDAAESAGYGSFSVCYNYPDNTSWFTSQTNELEWNTGNLVKFNNQVLIKDINPSAAYKLANVNGATWNSSLGAYAIKIAPSSTSISEIKYDTSYNKWINKTEWGGNVNINYAKKTWTYTLNKGSSVSSMEYSTNGGSSWTEITSSQTLTLDYSTTLKARVKSSTITPHYKDCNGIIRYVNFDANNETYGTYYGWYGSSISRSYSNNGGSYTLNAYEEVWGYSKPYVVAFTDEYGFHGYLQVTNYNDEGLETERYVNGDWDFQRGSVYIPAGQTRYVHGQRIDYPDAANDGSGYSKTMGVRFVGDTESNMSYGYIKRIAGKATIRPYSTTDKEVSFMVLPPGGYDCYMVITTDRNNDEYASQLRNIYGSGTSWTTTNAWQTVAMNWFNGQTVWVAAYNDNDNYEDAWFPVSRNEAYLHSEWSDGVSDKIAKTKLSAPSNVRTDYGYPGYIYLDNPNPIPVKLYYRAPWENSYNYYGTYSANARSINPGFGYNYVDTYVYLMFKPADGYTNDYTDSDASGGWTGYEDC